MAATILTDTEAHALVEQITGEQGYEANPVDVAAVHRILGQAAQATTAQRKGVATQMRSMIQRRERSKERQTGEWVSLETMAAAVAALEAV